jgi:F-type H+-transporting ATPase subunit epsilon
MHLDIVTPEKNIYSDEINALTVPTTTGEITILPGHINLLTQIAPGELVIKDKKTVYMGITGGFLEINNNTITILADFAVESEKIAVEKAIEAQKRADELRTRMTENLSQQDMAIASGELRRSLMELHVAQRRRHRDRIVPNS